MRRWKGMFVDIGVAGAFIGLIGMVFLLQSIPRATQPETVTAETQETVQQAEKTVSVRVKETEDPSVPPKFSRPETHPARMLPPPYRMPLHPERSFLPPVKAAPPL